MQEDKLSEIIRTFVDLVYEIEDIELRERIFESVPRYIKMIVTKKTQDDIVH